MHDLLLDMKRQREAGELTVTTFSDFEQRYDMLLAIGFETFPLLPRPLNSSKRVAQHPITQLLL